MEAISRSFINIYLIHRYTRLVEIIKLDGYVTEGIDSAQKRPYSYEEICENYIKNRVYEEDLPVVTDFLKWENVKNLRFINSSGY